MTKTAKLMIVGFGPHSKQTFYPVLEKYGETWGAQVACIVDLESRKQDIEAYFASRTDHQPEAYYVDSSSVGLKRLGATDEKNLDALVKKHRINGLIITTEPSSHMMYARWAMKNGLNVLIEKPISTRKNAAADIIEAKGLLDDYDELLELYEKAKEKSPDLVVSVMAQRRYHNSFLKIKELLSEVFVKTGCPITAIQIYHADGQWRTPDELIDIDYHGFNRGFGVLSHSGYHVFDVVPFLLEATQKPDSEIDNIDAISTFMRPTDLLNQMSYRDYTNLFPGFSSRYSESEYAEKTRNFGEVDAYTSLTFKHEAHVMAQTTISLLHNSFSQRAWLSSEGRELAKGNGRIGHETYQISQGPFQTIYCESYKGRKTDQPEADMFSLGGKCHIDVHAFRNDKMFPDWEPYQKFSAGEMELDFPLGDFSWSAHEGARRKCIKEFIDYLRGSVKREDLLSELPAHRKGVILTSAAYQSAVHRLNNENPLVNLAYEQRGAALIGR